ncbi:MAG: peptide chain release factor N(5)-glutamine methyltransferase [Spirochaetaceae bacterium]|nr:MAG: peptide chain release factor N(5)-glutamine methyltransferase [Spirochaetaceae bacterium]
MVSLEGRTIRAALRSASAALHRNGIETPWLDSVVLLCHALQISKERLFARLDDPLHASPLHSLTDAVNRRLAGEPVSYIRGIKEFYGREFSVDRRVMVPRPETETLVETALELIDADPTITRVHDCCSGSGCVAVTLALERPQLQLSASDVSQAALEVCSANVRHLAAGSVEVYHSDLLQSVPGRFDLIVANPPYVTDDEVDSMLRSGWPEPEVSLAGGPDGLRLIRRLAAESIDHLGMNRYLVLEGAFDQRASVFNVFHHSGLRDVDSRADLGGRDRVYLGRRIAKEDDSDTGGV